MAELMNPTGTERSKGRVEFRGPTASARAFTWRRTAASPSTFRDRRRGKMGGWDGAARSDPRRAARRAPSPPFAEEGVFGEDGELRSRRVGDVAAASSASGGPAPRRYSP